MLKHHKKQPTPEQIAIGRRIRESIESLGRGGKTYLASKAIDREGHIGITPQSVTGWQENGRISKENLLILEKETGYSAEWILTGKGQKFTPASQSHDIQGQLDDVEGIIEASSKKAPQFREPGPDYLPVRMGGFHLQAGVIGYGLDFLEEEKAPIFFRADWYSVNGYKPERLVACQIKGDSMEPRLYAGDIVVINLDDTQPIDGSVFAINYEGELVIKRLKRDRGEWQLSSDNADKVKHPDKVCSSDICILIGKVVYRQSSEI